MAFICILSGDRCCEASLIHLVVICIYFCVWHISESGIAGSGSLVISGASHDTISAAAAHQVLPIPPSKHLS